LNVDDGADGRSTLRASTFSDAVTHSIANPTTTRHTEGAEMRTLRAVAITVAMTALALLAIGSANDGGAHSDVGILNIEASPSDDDRTIEVNVTLKYPNDSDPATGANVTVFATNTDDKSTAPTALTDIGLGGHQGSLKDITGGTRIFTARAENPEAIGTGTIALTEQSKPIAPATTADPAPARPPEEQDDTTVQTVAAVTIGLALLASATIIIRRRRTP